MYKSLSYIKFQKFIEVPIKMPSRRSRREMNLSKKIAKLNDDCCVGESQDIEEHDSFQEAHDNRRLATGSATKLILRVK